MGTIHNNTTITTPLEIRQPAAEEITITIKQQTLETDRVTYTETRADCIEGTITKTSNTKIIILIITIQITYHINTITTTNISLSKTNIMGNIIKFQPNYGQTPAYF